MFEQLFGDLRIRPMQAADVPAVSDLDQRSFTLPWPARAFESELSNPMARSWVVDLPQQEQQPLIACLVIWLILDEAHIATLAIDAAYRRQGIARVLLGYALLSAQKEGAVCALLEVRRSNLAALRLYESSGFVQVGVRKKYYSDNQEDALLMNLEQIDATYWQQVLNDYGHRFMEVKGEF